VGGCLHVSSCRELLATCSHDRRTGGQRGTRRGDSDGGDTVLTPQTIAESEPYDE
jgi:hypothetical protein